MNISLYQINLMTSLAPFGSTYNSIGAAQAFISGSDCTHGEMTSTTYQIKSFPNIDWLRKLSITTWRRTGDVHPCLGFDRHFKPTCYVGNGLESYTFAPFGRKGAAEEYIDTAFQYNFNPSLIYIYRICKLSETLIDWKADHAAQCFIDLLVAILEFSKAYTSQVTSSAFCFHDVEILEALNSVYSRWSWARNFFSAYAPLDIHKIVSDLVLPEEFLRTPFSLLQSLEVCSQINALISCTLKKLQQYVGRHLDYWYEPRIHLVFDDLLHLPFFEPWCTSTSYPSYPHLAGYPRMEKGVGRFTSVRIMKRSDFQKKDKRNLYLIMNTADGSLKIGVSKNTTSRLRALQTSSSSDLILIKEIQGMGHFEKVLHFKALSLGYHLRGEWFSRDAWGCCLSMFETLEANAHNIEESVFEPLEANAHNMEEA